MKHTYFRPKASLLIHLGDKLIKDEFIAISELIKNSYDADSKNVTLRFIKTGTTEALEIQDDGEGMTTSVILNNWLSPGSSSKSDESTRLKKTPKYKRFPIGEKGIGRFGVHKLGEKITLTTKSQKDKEIQLSIDWNLYKKDRYLDEIPVNVTNSKTSFFKAKTGTLIRIENLKFKLDENFIRKSLEAMHSLQAPFSELENFNIQFDFVGIKKPEGISLNNEDFLQWAMFNFEIEVKDFKLTKFIYNFTPPKNVSRLKSKRTVLKDLSFQPIRAVIDKKLSQLDQTLKIGEIKFQGYIFDLDRILLNSLGINPKTIKTFLATQGGIRVYRDKLRVYNYGEPGDDWLQLDATRINNPTKSLSNNLIVSSIELSRERSKELIEKTNREGFIQNPAFESFKEIIYSCIHAVEIQRSLDKSLFKESTNKNNKNSEPVLHELKEIGKIVETKIKDKALRVEIKTHLEIIEKDYKYLKEVLIKSSNAGLSLSTALHEIEKIIGAVSSMVKDGKYDKGIKDLISHLQELVNNYLHIVKKSNNKINSLSGIIENATFNMQFRLKNHQVVLKNEISKNIDINIKVPSNLIIGLIINILDNSIYWLDVSTQKKKEICIYIFEKSKTHITLAIADNGTGFLIPFEDAIKPFISAKDHGIGLGLTIIKEILTSIDGDIEFIEQNIKKNQSKYTQGATALITFKRA